MANLNTNNVKTSIFYINDYHGKVANMERTVSAAKFFDYQNQREDIDTFKLSSGDIMVGDDVTKNKLAIMFQNIIGISASALGNHEFDMQEKLKDIVSGIKYSVLSTNTKITEQHPYSNIVLPSKIEELNGHKYGIIGTSPVDLYERTKKGITHTEVKVYNTTETLDAIQKEVNSLQAQGINKIILLSHLGASIEKIIAEQTQGIDVILGGHTHELIFDVKEGENLFYSKNGEPVIITQAGRDGKNFGILNLEFDNNGIIKKVQNNIGFTKDFKRYAPVKYIFDKLFPNNELLGQITSTQPPTQKPLIDPNPHACFGADCMREELDADVAIEFAANIRGHFEKGNLNTRELEDIFPFKNNLMKVKYSEKELVDAIKYSATSLNTETTKPGILHTSGLKYTLNKNGKLLSMSFIDKKGKETLIDINNPKADKFYTTIVDNYIGKGCDNFVSLNQPDRVIEKYPFAIDKCVSDYIKKRGKIEIQDDERIKIV